MRMASSVLWFTTIISCKEWIGGFKQWKQGDELGSHVVVQAGWWCLGPRSWAQTGGRVGGGGWEQGREAARCVQETFIGRNHETCWCICCEQWELRRNQEWHIRFWLSNFDGWWCYWLIREIWGEEGTNYSVLGIFKDPAKILPPS